MGAKDRVLEALGGEDDLVAVVVSWRTAREGAHRFARVLVRVQGGGREHPEVYELRVNAHGFVEELPAALSSRERGAVIGAVRRVHAGRS
jgi:hypothetical protein